MYTIDHILYYFFPPYNMYIEAAFIMELIIIYVALIILLY